LRRHRRRRERSVGNGLLVNDPIPYHNFHHQPVGEGSNHEVLCRLLKAFELHNARWEIFVQGSSMVVLDVVEIFLGTIRVVKKRTHPLTIFANLHNLLPIFGDLHKGVWVSKDKGKKTYLKGLAVHSQFEVAPHGLKHRRKGHLLEIKPTHLLFFHIVG
jgi:hypothetical protein